MWRSEEYLRWRLFERFNLGLPTEEKWSAMDEEMQILSVTYERIREAEEADELGNLMQASSLGAIKRKSR